MNKEKILLHLSMFILVFIGLLGGLLNVTKLNAFDNSYVIKYLPIPDNYVTDEVVWTIGDIQLDEEIEEFSYIYSCKGINYTTIQLQYNENHSRYELHYIDRNQLSDIVVFTGYEDSHLFYDDDHNTNVYCVLGSWYDLSYSVINFNNLSTFETYSSENLGYYYNNNISDFINLGNIDSYTLENNYILDFNLVDFDTNILGFYYLGEFFYNQEYFKYLQFFKDNEDNIFMRLMKSDTRYFLIFNLNNTQDIEDLKVNFFANRSYKTNSNYELDTIITFTDNIDEVNGWDDFFGSIINVPIIYLTSLLNFNILGFNMWLIFTSILSFILLIYILKRFL